MGRVGAPRNGGTHDAPRLRRNQGGRHDRIGHVTGAEPARPVATRHWRDYGRGGRSHRARCLTGECPSRLHHPIDDSNSGAGGITLLTDSTFQATLRDAGGQVFDVRAFGATGSGTVDDTLHVQAAQSAAGPGCATSHPARTRSAG